MDLISQALEETENQFQVPLEPMIEKRNTIKPPLNQNVASLMDENFQLQGQYEMLQVEYNNKIGAVSQYQSAIKNFETQLDAFKAQNIQKDSSYPLSETEKMGNELLIKQSKHFYLKGQLLDMEEKARLAKMQLADLQFQKEELGLKVKSKTFEFNEQKRKQEEEIENYKTALRASFEKEKTLSQEIRRIQQDAAYAGDKAKKLKEENDFFKKQVENFKVQKELSEKEIALIRKKQLFVNKSFEDVLMLKQDMKQKLEDIVGRLDKEYKSLDEMIEQSLAFRKQQEDLMKKVIEVDKANQVLRRKIEESNKK
jgi:hypothetical protein